MIRKKYSDEDYTKAYLSLNQEQRAVIDNYVKVGYKTKWLYIMAKEKGLIIDEEKITDKDREILNELYKKLEWILIDYTDYLKRNNHVRCECGKALRHAYTVKHVPTKKIYILGRDHFEQYTNICPDDVKEIFGKFKMIDLEKTELLGKVIENKDMDIRIIINSDFDIPKDIIKQLDVNLPLLDR